MVGPVGQVVAVDCQQRLQNASFLPFNSFAMVIRRAKTLIVAEKPSVGRDLAAALPGAFKQSADKTHLDR